MGNFLLYIAAPVETRVERGRGPSRRAKHRRVLPSDGDVANTARLLSETEEIMLFLFRREPRPIRAAKPPRLKGPMKRGPCFGWRPTKSRSRENRGRGAQTVGILSTQDVSAGLDL